MTETPWDHSSAHILGMKISSFQSFCKNDQKCTFSLPNLEGTYILQFWLILLIFTKRLKGGNFHSKNMHRAMVSWCFSHHLGPKDCPRMVLQHRKHIGTDRATKLFTTRWENGTLFLPYIGSQVAYWLLTFQ